MHERVQVVERLPRNGGGDIRTDILQLVAMNQIDLIDLLLSLDVPVATLPFLLTPELGPEDLETLSVELERKL